MVLMQAKYLAEARAFRDANIVDVTTYSELQAAISSNKWARGGWSASNEEEDRVKVNHHTPATYPNPATPISFHFTVFAN